MLLSWQYTKRFLSPHVAANIFLHCDILLNGSVDLIRVLLSFQCTKALSDLTAKLGPNVDGARAYLVCHAMRIKGILGGIGRAKPFR